jgi:hypothetical protein
VLPKVCLAWRTIVSISWGVCGAAASCGSAALLVFVGSCQAGVLVENCLTALVVRQGRAAAAVDSAEGACTRRRRNGWAVGLLRGSKRAS